MDSMTQSVKIWPLARAALLHASKSSEFTRITMCDRDGCKVSSFSASAFIMDSMILKDFAGRSIEVDNQLLTVFFFTPHCSASQFRSCPDCLSQILISSFDVAMR